jgi:hypothetical protein
VPNGGLPSCTTDVDCIADGGVWALHCLRGTCSFDECLADGDCRDGVCGCSTDYSGGNSLYRPNVCVQAGCHVDSDCGSGGFCSPSRGRCGAFEGFFCHCSSDPCVDPTTDCAGGRGSCVYTPTVSEFTCEVTLCNG